MFTYLRGIHYASRSVLANIPVTLYSAKSLLWVHGTSMFKLNIKTLTCPEAENYYKMVTAFLDSLGITNKFILKLQQPNSIFLAQTSRKWHIFFWKWFCIIQDRDNGKRWLCPLKICTTKIPGAMLCHCGLTSEIERNAKIGSAYLLGIIFCIVPDKILLQYN